jgi:imidazolonepropionase-like amidohydrolase
VKSLALAIALVGATVYTGEGPPLHGATVVIEGTRIHSVGTKLRPPEGVKLIDASGMVITPGLVAVGTASPDASSSRPASRARCP